LHADFLLADHKSQWRLKLTPARVLTVLYNFNAKPGSVDGNLVDAGLVQATDGRFYGVTDAGGTNGFGIVVLCKLVHDFDSCTKKSWGVNWPKILGCN